MLELLFYLFLLAMAIILPICLVIWGIYQILKRFIHIDSPMDRHIRSNELMNGSNPPLHTFRDKFFDSDDDD